MQCLFLEEWFFVEPLLKERAVVEREVLVSWHSDINLQTTFFEIFEFLSYIIMSTYIIYTGHFVIAKLCQIAD